MTAPWPIKSLGEVCTVVNGGTPKSKVSEYWGGDVNWITPAEMGEMTSPYIESTNRKITELGLQKSSAKLFPPHSVILSTRAPIGHLAINTSPMSTNQGCKTLVPNDELEHKYLYYFLYYNKELLDSLGTGTTFKELSGKNLKEVMIPVPPLNEQQRIVSNLDKAFQNIENGTSQAQHKLHNGKEMFQSVVANILSQKGEGWSEKRLGEICEILDKFRKPITKRNRVSGEYPYYGATGIVDYVNGYIFDEKLILIGEDGAKWESGENTAFAVEGKYWVNNHAHVIRPNRSIVIDNWLIYFLNMSDLTEHITGLTVPKLNQGKLRDIQIPIPPLEEQKRIVNKLDSLSQNVALLEENHRSEIESLVELKHSILQEAFNGNL